MSKSEKLEQFYDQKFGWLPDNLRKDFGHFNVFVLEDHSDGNTRIVPYRRRDYYKITFLKSNGAEVHYADKSVQVNKQALAFSNPQIPYSWENIETIMGGYYCIFDTEFFSRFGNLQDYSVFKPGGTHLFELDDNQAETVISVFRRMQEEFQSGYVHKYDLLRNLTFELIHFAMKLQPSVASEKQPQTALQRVSTLFAELLERQFPIERMSQNVKFRSASDFAKQLNIHVNYLNRAVKETTGKTTTEIIGERLLQEAKIMLLQSELSVSEIAYMLGFSEASRFNDFFKKMTNETPTQFRKV
ncbi:MAG: helix-turn-helix domain-containing protein [Cruoricaptor ignavus]|nr:helix-turn-helix domain-containing protein [Cruoricaptor ignavus]